MNYTSNYHLPQWVEADQVRMEDFNSAMKALEDALSSNRESAFRQAHNTLLLSEALGVNPEGGMTQSLKGGALPAGASGLVVQETCGWVSTGSVQTSTAQLAKAITSSQGLTMAKGDPSNCAPMLAEFTSQGPGKLTCLTLTGRYTNNEGCTGKMRVTLRNLTLGVVEAQEDAEMYWGASTANGTFYLMLSMMFRGGCKYRIEVIGLEDKYNCLLSYDSRGLTAEGLDAPSGTLSGTLTQAGDVGGVAMARYISTGSGGGITLNWNGKTLSPTSTGTASGTGGETLQVAKFRADGPISAGSKPVLTLRSPINGSISLYGWGAMVV